MTAASAQLSWPEVRDWRKATRKEILDARRESSVSERERVAAMIATRIEEQFPALRHAVVGLYWPIRAELDARGLATRLISQGARIGLPVVVERNQPLEFWAWKPGDAMERGDWNIPVPAVRKPVHADYLIVPVVGFDDACYRLGYGGGYYDRTLAAMDPRPTTIGIGPESARLDTIYPQPHDIPLDVIVTEKIIRNRRNPTEDDDPNERRSYASPPCFMHDVAGEGVAAMTRNQKIRLLNELLEAERAGGRGITAIAGGYEVPDRHLLKEVAVDEGRFCAMLSGHITRLGGVPSRKTGAFHDKLVGMEPGAGQVTLLNRGQRWVVRKLAEAIPLLGDEELRADLVDMLNVHERNIRRCADMESPDRPSQ